MTIYIYRKLHDGRTVFKHSDAPGDVFFALNDEEMRELLALVKPEQEPVKDYHPDYGDVQMDWI